MSKAKDLQSCIAYVSRGDLPRGVPIPWTGKLKRTRRKMHGRGKGNMMANRYYSVAPSRYCCDGHDYIPYEQGIQRTRENVSWRKDYVANPCDETIRRILEG